MTIQKTSRRADLAAIIFALCFPTALTFVYFMLLAAAPLVFQYAAYGSLKTIQFAFPLVWVLVVQRQRLNLHLPRRQGLIAGVAFGLVVMVAMWLLYKFVMMPTGLMDEAREPIEAKISGFGLSSLLSYAALAIFYSLVHSLLEEYYWRWFVFGQLRRFAALPSAIVISSIGFMAHHVILLGTFFGWTSPLCWIFSISVAIGGAVWAWMYDRIESLYPPWISHLLVDAGIFVVGWDFVLRAS